MTGFRPGVPLTLAVALAGILLLALGTWQVRRLAWKETLIAEIEAGLAAEPLLVEPTTDAAALRAWRPVRLRAKMMAGSSRRLGVEGREGRPGSRLLGVFRDEAGRSWLVDRGWIPEDRPLAAFDLRGEVMLEGVLRPPRGANMFTPDAAPGGERVFVEETGGAGLQPLVLQLTEPAGGGSAVEGEMPRPAPARPVLTNNHLGYAITWYGLFAALVGVYVAYGRVRAREESR